MHSWLTRGNYKNYMSTGDGSTSIIVNMGQGMECSSIGSMESDATSVCSESQVSQFYS